MPLIKIKKAKSWFGQKSPKSGMMKKPTIKLPKVPKMGTLGSIGKV